MDIKKSMSQIFGSLCDFDVGERPGAPDVEIAGQGEGGAIFGVLVERKNFQLRPHLKEAEAWAALRERHLGTGDQYPVVFAKDPDEDRVYAFLLAEDLRELLDVR